MTIAAPPGLSPQERLDRFTDKTGDCWIWTGRTDDRGYGQLMLFGKVERAHRVALSLKLGRPLSGWALHHCDNPPCLRPEHLYEGDALDNSHDCINRGRFKVNAAKPGELHHNSKLTEADVREIRQLGRTGMRQQDIGARFGIRQSSISLILRRRAWAHVS